MNSYVRIIMRKSGMSLASLSRATGKTQTIVSNGILPTLRGTSYSTVTSNPTRFISGTSKGNQTKTDVSSNDAAPPPSTPKINLLDLAGYNPISALYARGSILPAEKKTVSTPVWSESHVQTIEITHVSPKTFADNMAFRTVDLLKNAWKLISRLEKGPRNETKWLTHILCMESIAAVPGVAAAVGRHARSMVTLQADAECFRATLAEVESQRLHCLTVTSLAGGGFLPKAGILAAQTLTMAIFLPLGLLSPKYCHRVSAYLAEEKVSAYTLCLGDLTAGILPAFKIRTVPAETAAHWRLGPSATLQHVLLCLRADEAHHRALCHALAAFSWRRGSVPHPGAHLGSMPPLSGSSASIPSYPRGHHTKATEGERGEEG